MPMFVRVPDNANISNISTYNRYLNVLDRKQTAVQRQLRRGGLASYEPLTQAAILAACTYRDKVVFYDVGAHIGVYSALVAAIFAYQKPTVIAFEPTPSTADQCRKLIKANQLNFSLVPKAVSSFDGKVSLFISPKAETSNSLDHEFRHASESIEVDAIRIDSFVEAGNEPPTVIKIDVETHEAAVVAGAMKVIEQYRPTIILEILPGSKKVEMQDLLMQLGSLGYRIFHLEKEALWEEKTIDDVFSRANSSSRDWLLSPTNLSDGFVESAQAWIEAIAKCDAQTNQFKPPYAVTSVRSFPGWRFLSRWWKW